MRLTPREQAVCRLIANSKTDRQIAEELHLSFHTVRGYVKDIYRKLGISKRTGVGQFRVLFALAPAPIASPDDERSPIATNGEATRSTEVPDEGTD